MAPNLRRNGKLPGLCDRRNRFIHMRPRQAFTRTLAAMVAADCDMETHLACADHGRRRPGRRAALRRPLGRGGHAGDGGDGMSDTRRPLARGAIPVCPEGERFCGVPVWTGYEFETPAERRVM